MLKFTVDQNWLPKKLKVAIQLDPESSTGDGHPRADWYLDLTGFRSAGGLQPDEEAMPEDVGEFIVFCSSIKKVYIMKSKFDYLLSKYLNLMFVYT